MGFYRTRYTYNFLWFSNKMTTHSPFLGNPCIPLFKLCLIIYLMKRKEIQKRKLNDTPCESIISVLVLFLKNMFQNMRRYIHSDIVPLIMEYHQLTLKSLNKLKLFKKLFYQEYPNWLSSRQETKRPKSSIKI